MRPSRRARRRASRAGPRPLVPWPKASMRRLTSPRRRRSTCSSSARPSWRNSVRPIRACGTSPARSWPSTRAWRRSYPSPAAASTCCRERPCCRSTRRCSTNFRPAAISTRPTSASNVRSMARRSAFMPITHGAARARPCARSRPMPRQSSATTWAYCAASTGRSSAARRNCRSRESGGRTAGRGSCAPSSPRGSLGR